MKKVFDIQVTKNKQESRQTARSLPFRSGTCEGARILPRGYVTSACYSRVMLPHSGRFYESSFFAFAWALSQELFISSTKVNILECSRLLDKNTITGFDVSILHAYYETVGHAILNTANGMTVWRPKRTCRLLYT